jgi:acetyl esterase/lipase
MDTPSKKEEAAAKPLNTPMMAWFFDKVLNNDADKQDPRLNLVSADLKGLPPTTIINAEIDPLRSDGDMLTDKMKAAGDDVTHKILSRRDPRILRNGRGRRQGQGSSGLCGLAA